MRVGALPSTVAQAWAVHLAQMTGRVAAHRSTATDRPIEPPAALTDDTLTRRPSRHTFDIRI